MIRLGSIPTRTSVFRLWLLAALLPAGLAASGHCRQQQHLSSVCLEASPLQVDFDTVTLGGKAERTVVIRNRCSQAVTVYRISGQPESFSAQAPIPWKIGGKSTRDLLLVFAPQQAGESKGWLTLETKAKGSTRGNLRIPVVGVGSSPPSIAVMPGSLHLAMKPGSDGKAFLQVTNSGGARLEAILDARSAPLPRPAAGWKVLYFSTRFPEDANDDFITGMRSLDNIDTLAIWNGFASVPPLSRLREYDIVIAEGGVSAAQPWKDAEASGNVLAAYATSGGKVLLMATAMAEGRTPLGGAIPNFYPLHTASMGVGGTSVELADHPITIGGSFSSETAMSSTTTPGQGQGIPLGRYQNGVLVGAYHPYYPVVALNIVSNGLGGGAYALMGNAVDWLGTGMGWLTPQPELLVVEPGMTREVTAIFHSWRMFPGTREASLWFLHNAGGITDSLAVPVSMEVSEMRCLSADTLRMDTVSVGWPPIRKSLRLVNHCNAPTRIASMEMEAGPFSFEPVALPADVPAFGNIEVTVQFSGGQPGTYTSALAIASDAQDHPELRAVITGTVRPGIGLTHSPDSFSAALTPGETTVKTLTLHNGSDKQLGIILGTVVEPLGATSPTALKVLYYTTTLEEGMENNFLWNLQGQNKITSVTVRSGTTFTPTLEYLQGYDVVVVSSYGAWADGQGAGNALADYADAGGRLILLNAALSNGGLGLQGRIIEPGYSPVALAGPGGMGYAEGFSGQTMLEGVAFIGAGYTIAADTVQGSAVSLGKYDNGHLIGAYSTDKRIVFLNFLPVEGEYQAGVTIERLIANALDHLQGTFNWIKVPEPGAAAPYHYSLAPGESAEVPVTLGHSRHLPAGTHQGYIEFGENATGSSFRVPVTLEIQAAAEPAVSAARLGD